MLRLALGPAGWGSATEKAGCMFLLGDWAGITSFFSPYIIALGIKSLHPLKAAEHAYFRGLTFLRSWTGCDSIAIFVDATITSMKLDLQESTGR